jgi:hypothetical protein
MPRRRQTRSGDPAQKIESVPGRRYGEGVAQQEMQRAMPAPVRRSDVSPPSPAGSPAAPPAAPTPTPGYGPQDIQAYLSENNPQLFRGTQLPNQPVTSGLSTGPGRGPEALRSRQTTTPTGRFLRQLYESTGDPKWARMLERSRL